MLRLLQLRSCATRVLSRPMSSANSYTVLSKTLLNANSPLSNVQGRPFEPVLALDIT